MNNLVTQFSVAVWLLPLLGLVAAAVQCRNVLRRILAAGLPQKVKECFRALLDGEANWGNLLKASALAVIEGVKALALHFVRRPSELFVTLWLIHEITLTRERWTTIISW